MLRLFCSHRFEYKFVDKYFKPFSFVPSCVLVYKCPKCGKWKKVDVNTIKEKISKYRYKNNELYPEKEVLLPGQYFDTLYRGKHIGHLVQDYMKKGIDLTVYR